MKGLTWRERDLIRRRVSRGIRRLNKVRPEWARSWGMTSLVMSDGGMCVLGRAFGHYVNGLSALNLTERGAVMLGFDAPENYYADNKKRHAYFDRLGEEWRERVEEIRGLPTRD